MHWKIIFFVGIFSIPIHSQSWSGTYTVVSTCNIGSCCCASNEIILAQIPSNLLTVNTSLAGTCFGQTYYSASVSYPNGYTISVTYLVVTLTITLSSDSNNLTIANSLGSSCNGQAVRKITSVITTSTTTGTTTVRNNTIRQYINMMMFFTLIFSSSFSNIRLLCNNLN